MWRTMEDNTTQKAREIVKIFDAIQQLEYAKEIINRTGKDYLDERDIPILDMAIKALEKQRNALGCSSDS